MVNELYFISEYYSIIQKHQLLSSLFFLQHRKIMFKFSSTENIIYVDEYFYILFSSQEEKCVVINLHFIMMNILLVQIACNGKKLRSDILHAN